MQHRYKIFQLEANPQYNGLNNIVVSCKVHVNSTDEYTKASGENPHTSTVDTYRLLEYTFDPDSANADTYTDFDDLTEEQVLGWIPQSVKDALEAEIEAELNEKAQIYINWDKEKKVIKDLPW